MQRTYDLYISNDIFDQDLSDVDEHHRIYANNADQAKDEAFDILKDCANMDDDEIVNEILNGNIIFTEIVPIDLV